jgi:hypothetical protein
VLGFAPAARVGFLVFPPCARFQRSLALPPSGLISEVALGFALKSVALRRVRLLLQHAAMALETAPPPVFSF